MHIIKLINNILFPQYELRVEDYLYDKVTKQITILLKPHLSRCELKISVNKITTNSQYIEKLHPYDCYIIGYISCMLHENIMPDKAKLTTMKHNNEKVKPFLIYNGIDYFKKEIKFLVKNSKTAYPVKIEQFIKNPAILRGISSTDALQLGYIITDILLESKGQLHNG